MSRVRERSAGDEPHRAAAGPDRGEARTAAGAGLLVGALGVVFGDIGTSPLYAMQAVFSIDGGAVRPTAENVLGVVSLVFWSVTLVVSVKYVIFIMRADNEGEGGVMALAALVSRAMGGRDVRRLAVVMGLGVLGAALLYGDSVITPAISVLSAVEGLEVAAPSLSHLVLPIAVIVLTVLFAVQRWGTERVGNLFGPIMVVWFLAIAAAGLAGVLAHPAILRGLSPTYALLFAADHPYTAFVAMGAVVLAITGAEALYADMGQFGRIPVRRAWFVIVFPALTLNYLAQAALILHDPASRANPFYLLVPAWARVPMVFLATAATVIASQAVLSGAFTLSRQAVRLGYLPRLPIRQTSRRVYGQIYVPTVNWVLFATVLLVVLTFGSSARLATAYGVAVTGTFLITTTLFLILARMAWRWPVWQCVLVAVVFGGLELTFFAANLSKIIRGGWLTLLIAVVVLTVMLTWRRGREIVTARREELEGPLLDFILEMKAGNLPRVPGTGVFPHRNKETAPLALRANVAHNHVRHDRIVIISGRTVPVSHVPWSHRISVDHLGDPNDGIIHIAVDFGFQDPPDLPEVLRHVTRTRPETDLEPDDVSYFVSRTMLRRTDRPGMATWRKRLFLALAHDTASQAQFLHLPEDRTVILSTEIPL